MLKRTIILADASSSSFPFDPIHIVQIQSHLKGYICIVCDDGESGEEDEGTLDKFNWSRNQ